MDRLADLVENTFAADFFGGLLSQVGYQESGLTPARNTVAVALALLTIVTLVLNALLRNMTTPPTKKKTIPVILGMATGTPEYRVSQLDALAVAESAPECETIRPVLSRIYGNSKIEHRYMAVPDFTPNQKRENDPNFFPKDGSFKVPVEVRLKKFEEKAKPLVEDVCRRAMRDAGIKPEEIGKLVVVSSTGFLGPGLDCELIKALGLSRSVDRALVGFMGCAAAMNGFRIACDHVVAHPNSISLLCCVELSSVHTTFDDNVNDAILHAIFADGCAAAVISGASSSKNTKRAVSGKFGIIDAFGYLMEGTEDGITLSINENGISCTLSKYLPQYIAKNMGGYVDAFLSRHRLVKKDLDFWAIHPGGRRIIEEAQNGLGLTQQHAKYSWDVLANYGNMLSPSVMFVLDLVRKDHVKARAAGEKGVNLGIAFSFSPGVGAEGILIKVM